MKKPPLRLRWKTERPLILEWIRSNILKSPEGILITKKAHQKFLRSKEFNQLKREFGEKHTISPDTFGRYLAAELRYATLRVARIDGQCTRIYDGAQLK